MYILEYVTEWENGESVLNRFECETYAEAEEHQKEAKLFDKFIFGDYCGYPINMHYNHSFRIEEVS